jgi:uncharacterized repeat protein (TIGR03803 family)
MNSGKPSASNPFFAILLLLGGLLLRLPGLGSSVNFSSYTNLFVNLTEDGGYPRGSLALGSDGATLFGTTLQGDGTNYFGTVFSIKTDGSNFQTLHRFTGTNGDGNLSVVVGVPRQYASQSGNLGGLLLGKDGILYGTTPGGGGAKRGTIYRIGQDGNGYQVIHSFDSEPTLVPLIQTPDGLLYGISGVGSIFRLNTDGSDFAVVTNLFPNIGYALSGLSQGSDGHLYGTGTGTNGQSSTVVFSVSTNGSDFRALHQFSESEGSRAFGTPLLLTNGLLVGTFNLGNGGGIYLVDTNGTRFQVVHYFGDGLTTNEGVMPSSGLVLGADGWLYGTTSGNGVFNSGLYKIRPDGSGYEQLLKFNGVAYGPPTAGSFQGSTGALFGITAFGGAFGRGTVYSVVVNPPVSITPGTMTSQDGQTTVFWPAWAISYRLQSNTNLNTDTWVSVTNTTPVVGAIVPVSSGPVFYRLVSP